MKKLLILVFPLLAACASGGSKDSIPIGIGGGENDLRASVCNCGGLESEELNKAREKRKEESVKTNTINTDIVRDDR